MSAPGRSAGGRLGIDRENHMPRKLYARCHRWLHSTTTPPSHKPQIKENSRLVLTPRAHGTRAAMNVHSMRCTFEKHAATTRSVLAAQMTERRRFGTFISCPLGERMSGTQPNGKGTRLLARDGRTCVRPAIGRSERVSRSDLRERGSSAGPTGAEVPGGRVSCG